MIRIKQIAPALWRRTMRIFFIGARGAVVWIQRMVLPVFQCLMKHLSHGKMRDGNRGTINF